MDAAPLWMGAREGRALHFTIQRRIGYVLCGACLVVAALQLARMLSGPPPLEQYFRLSRESFQNLVFNLALAAVALITSRIDRSLFRLVQVLAFAFSGLLATSLTDTPYDATGAALLVYAILLAIQYSFFERHFVPKMALALVLTFGSLLAATFLRGSGDLLGSIAGVVAVATYLLLIWIAFAEKLKEYAERAREMEMELRKESVFVRFGRNVAGLVHNLRNLLSVLYGLNALLRRQTITEEGTDIVARQQAAYERMRRMVERILAVVRAKQETSVVSVDLNELLEGIVDFYATDLEFKNRVRVDFRLAPTRPRVEAQPLELCEVVENLIRNSWESLTGRGDEGGGVIEISTFDGPALGFRLRDNGPGIPGLARCADTECARYFAVGRSTKAGGTGLGMPFVLEAVRSNGWHLSIESERSRGTTTTIVLRGELAAVPT